MTNEYHRGAESLLRDIQHEPEVDEEESSVASNATHHIDEKRLLFYVREDLSAEEREGVNLHLAVCDLCTAVVEGLQEQRYALAVLEDESRRDYLARKQSDVTPWFHRQMRPVVGTAVFGALTLALLAYVFINAHRIALPKSPMEQPIVKATNKPPVEIVEQGARIIRSPDGKYYSEGLLPTGQEMVSHSKWPQPQESVDAKVQEAGNPKEAPLLKSPSGAVIAVPVKIDWDPPFTKAGVAKYFVRYKRIDISGFTLRQIEVPGNQTHFVLRDLEPGEYEYIVCAAINDRRASETLDSPWARFTILKKQYCDSDLMKGLAYAHYADKLPQAEHHFRAYLAQQKKVNSAQGILLAEEMITRLRKLQDQALVRHGN